VDFAPLSKAMEAADWTKIETILSDRARRLSGAGAEILLLCTNTMHKLAENVAAAAEPAEFLHIGTCAADEAVARGFGTVALLGTRFTMEEDFYRKHLKAAGLNVLTPDTSTRRWINELIFNELCAGVFREDARRTMADIVSGLADEGAEAVVLGCTELPLILREKESPLPILDTMSLHARAAVDAALDS
jgi:aspartate racemase